MLVTEEKVEGILEYLSQSDDDYGKLSARVKGLEKKMKRLLLHKGYWNIVGTRKQWLSRKQKQDVQRSTRSGGSSMKMQWQTLR